MTFSATTTNVTTTTLNPKKTILENLLESERRRKYHLKEFSCQNKRFFDDFFVINVRYINEITGAQKLVH